MRQRHRCFGVDSTGGALRNATELPRMGDGSRAGVIYIAARVDTRKAR